MLFGLVRESFFSVTRDSIRLLSTRRSAILHQCPGGASRWLSICYRFPGAGAMPPRKKNKAQYNDALDGERLTDNVQVRTSLQAAPSPAAGSDTPNSPLKTSERPKRPDLKKLSLTHFLAIPLHLASSGVQLQASLQRLAQDDLVQATVAEDALRPVGTLHITIGVMALNGDRVEAVCKTLDSLDLEDLLRGTQGEREGEGNGEDFGQGEKLSPQRTSSASEAMPTTASATEPWIISLRSLAAMKNPHKTSMLYALPHDPSGRLVPFCTAIKKHFEDDGWMQVANRPFKAHTTVINTIYSREEPVGAAADRQTEQRGNLNQNDQVRDASSESCHVLSRRPMLKPWQAAHPSDEADGNVVAAVTGEHRAVSLVSQTANEHPLSLAAASRKTAHRRKKRPLLFDATPLIDRYRNAVWAHDMVVDRIQLCKMGAVKVVNDQGEVVGPVYEVVHEKTFCETTTPELDS